jgi:hypothetical protein
MPISLAGLDLSFMRENPLPPRERKPRLNHASKRSEAVGVPYVMNDIKPFVSVATEEPVEITSRSQLRAYERDNDIRQCGDYKPGQVVAEQKERIEQATAIPDDAKSSVEFNWVD